MNNNTKGWIKLHRKLLDWEWYDDINTRLVFMHLLLTVNYEPSKYMGKTIEVGQRLFGRAKLAREIGLSEQQLRTALNRLKSTNEITIISTKQGSLVTIENWGSYQEKDSQDNQPINQPTNQQLTNDQPTTNQQPTIYKEVKNIRNKEDKNILYNTGISQDVWNGYLEMRKKIKKPLTERGQQLAIKKAVNLSIKCKCSPDDIIDQSTMNSWQGLFEIKQINNQTIINGEKNNEKSNMPDWQQKLNERYRRHDKPKFTSTQETY